MQQVNEYAGYHLPSKYSRDCSRGWFQQIQKYFLDALGSKTSFQIDLGHIKENKMVDFKNGFIGTVQLERRGKWCF